MRLAERIFLKLWCHPPPSVPFEPRDHYDNEQPPPPEADPLARAKAIYGSTFENALAGCVFLDIGCGLGNQVIGAAQAGATLAVGVDVTEVNLRIAGGYAEAAGVAERVRFTTDTVATFGNEWADVILSQNSFEHFGNPAEILAQAYSALKPDGLFFLTFSPPWWHPYGVHHFFMIKLPWAHRVFSEKTILSVRQLYRPNKPTCWREVALNQMTISKFVGLIERSGFTFSQLRLKPIRPLPQLVTRLKLTREWTTSEVSAVLVKKCENG